MSCTPFACILLHKQRYGCTLHHTNQNDSDFGFQFCLTLLEHGYIGDNRIELELSLESFVSALSIVPGGSKKSRNFGKIWNWKRWVCHRARDREGAKEIEIQQFKNFTESEKKFPSCLHKWTQWKAATTKMNETSVVWATASQQMESHDKFCLCI